MPPKKRGGGTVAEPDVADTSPASKRQQQQLQFAVALPAQQQSEIERYKDVPLLVPGTVFPGGGMTAAEKKRVFM